MLDHASPVPQWYSDERSELILDANEAALKFWRYDREQFIGLRATKLLWEDELERQKRLAKMNLWGETGPWKCRRGDGTTVYVTVRWQKIIQGDRLCDFVFVYSAGDSIASLERLETFQGRAQAS